MVRSISSALTPLAGAPAPTNAKRTATLLALGATALSLWGTSALALTNLVQNPSFETNNGNLQFGNNNPFNSSTNKFGKINGWSTKCNPGSCTDQAYGFIMDNTIATNGSPASGTGSTGEFGGLWLWGSTGSIAATQGKYFYGGDGAFRQPSIFQTINGLTVGQTYKLTFDWAAAQQFGFDGVTNEGWKVNFGNQTDTVANGSLSCSFPNCVPGLPNHGFSGWKSFSTTFTASATSQVLEFLALGAPTGIPPFSLLDNITLFDTSEIPVTAAPGPLGVLGAATAFGYSRRLRRRIQRG